MVLSFFSHELLFFLHPVFVHAPYLLDAYMCLSLIVLNQHNWGLNSQNLPML